jgi:riboflavin synthase
MFTGIVSGIGRVVSAVPDNSVVRLRIATPYDAAGVDLGASVSCSGVCLTVTAKETSDTGSMLAFDAAPETLKITNAGRWEDGTRLNLERALRMGDELGGHLVAGHVDGLARIIARDDFGSATRFTFDAPPKLARFIAPKGSVCLDGTSLTVNGVEGTQFTCLLIPHTLEVTTWGDRKAGDDVNLEIDLMARYAARLAEAGGLG